MMRFQLLFLVLALALAGCVDSVESVSREFRNANNEGVDAMMMITTEARAAQMTRRVFKPMRERYDFLERKVDILYGNLTKKEFVKAVYESDSLHIYLTELEVNRERYQLEIMRLRNLIKQYTERERELRRQEGDDNPQFDPRDVCPALYDLCNKDEVLKPLYKQLTDSKFQKYIDQFPQWKVEDLPKMYETFEKKRAIFKQKPRPVVLVS